MHVQCPSCETAYEIPVLRRPRTLRCARCATEWRVEPEPVAAGMAAEAPPAVAPGADPPATDPATDPAPTGSEPEPEPPMPAAPLAAGSPIATPATPPARRRMAAGAVLTAAGWALSVLAVIALLSGLWHWRVAIEHRWPPSLRLFHLLPHGVPAPGKVPGPAPDRAPDRSHGPAPIPPAAPPG